MVEALQEHPRDPNQILIGYSRGLIVIWDLHGSRVLCHFLSSQVGAGGLGHGRLPRGSPWPHVTRAALSEVWERRRWTHRPRPQPVPSLSPLSHCKATGERLLAAGRPSDCQLPLRRQLLPVARVRRQPATGAPAQLCALRSVLCPPPGTTFQRAGQCPLCAQPSLLLSSVGGQLLEAKPGAQRGCRLCPKPHSGALSGHCSGQDS